MKFPGKRKNKHYFPVGDKKRVALNEDLFDRQDIYIVGIEQLLVDVEVRVEEDFLERYGIKKGESMVLSDSLIEEIYQQLKRDERIVGEYPGGAVGNIISAIIMLCDACLEDNAGGEFATVDIIVIRIRLWELNIIT